MPEAIDAGCVIPRIHRGNAPSGFSNRFQRTIHLTRRARQRMLARGISEALLRDLIETGTVKHKDEQRLWIFKTYPDRVDNQLCAVVQLTSALIVKTVMHHFQPEP